MSNTGSNDPLGPIRGPDDQRGPIPVPGEGKPLPIPGFPGQQQPNKGANDKRPPAKGRPQPARPAPPAPGQGDSNLDRQVRERIKAYPGTITYNDLIRKSKRDSTILIVLMILLAAVFGASIGVIVSIGFGYADSYGGGYPNIRSTTGAQGFDPKLGSPRGGSVGSSIGTLLPAIMIGGVAGLLLGGGASVWSYFAGANAILRMTHARQVSKDDDPVLFNVVEEMAIAGGLPIPKIYMIDDDSLNAFATGRDPEHGVVAITRGLRAKLSRDELQGVMAHEIAHIRHYDIRFSMLMATMVGLIVIVSDGFLRTMLYSGAGRRGAGRAGGGGGGRGGGGAGIAMVVILVLAFVLAILSPIIARLLQMAYSRQREYLADAGAVELTRNPEGLASALAALARDTAPQKETANRGTAHMYIVNPLRKKGVSRSKGSKFSSHPPIDDRIARLLALLR